jgi:hypothetical protein
MTAGVTARDVITALHSQGEGSGESATAPALDGEPTMLAEPGGDHSIQPIPGESAVQSGVKAVERVAELQLAAFLAGRGSVTSMKHGTRTAKPAPSMDEFRNTARAALAATPTLNEGVEGVLRTALAAIECAQECAGIEWEEPIRRSKRGQEDDDESRKESKAMVYGLLAEAREKIAATLSKDSRPVGDSCEHDWKSEGANEAIPVFCRKCGKDWLAPIAAAAPVPDDVERKP